VTNLRIADLPGRGGKHGHTIPQQLAGLDISMTSESSDRNMITVVSNERELTPAPDIDEHRRCGQAQLHQRQERMAAGEDLGLIAVFGQHSEGVLHGVGAHVLE